MRSVVTDISEQATLVNAIARQPVVSRDGKWLYFSSNKAGNYHIWRLSLSTGEYEQLTNGYVTDESPALDCDDVLYFIRHSPDRPTLILRREVDGTVRELSLPEGVEDVRDLEINQW